MAILNKSYSKQGWCIWNDNDDIRNISSYRISTKGGIDLHLHTGDGKNPNTPRRFVCSIKEWKIEIQSSILPISGHNIQYMCVSSWTRLRGLQGWGSQHHRPCSLLCPHYCCGAIIQDHDEHFRACLYARLQGPGLYGQRKRVMTSQPRKPLSAGTCVSVTTTAMALHSRAVGQLVLESLCHPSLKGSQKSRATLRLTIPDFETRFHGFIFPWI